MDNKDTFIWTDNLVKEFTDWLPVDTLAGSVEISLFKESKKKEQLVKDYDVTIPKSKLDAMMESVFNNARLNHPMAGMKFDTFQDYYNSLPENQALNVEDKPVDNKVLFTTEDGVNVYKDDFIWLLSLDRWHAVKCAAPENPFYGNLNQFKYFSTKEKAEEYVLMNKPCLSLKEVVDKSIYAGKRDLPTTNPHYIALKDLVKEKLNNK